MLFVEFVDDAGNKCTINLDQIIYFEKNRDSNGTTIACVHDIEINVQEDYEAVKTHLNALLEGQF